MPIKSYAGFTHVVYIPHPNHQRHLDLRDECLEVLGEARDWFYLNEGWRTAIVAKNDAHLSMLKLRFSDVVIEPIGPAFPAKFMHDYAFLRKTYGTPGKLLPHIPGEKVRYMETSYRWTDDDHQMTYFSDERDAKELDQRRKEWARDDMALIMAAINGLDT